MKYFSIIIALSSLFFAGCATHTSQTQSVRTNWTAGGTQAAQAELKVLSDDNSDSGDALIWQLELGAVSRASGDFKTSIGAFKTAFNSVEKFEKESDIQLAEETGAIFTNQSFIPYKGYNYDKIMMSIYQSMNYMETKDFERAAVELKRLEFFQQNSERANKERIQRDEKSVKNAQKKEKNANYDVSKTISNPTVAAKFQEMYGDGYQANSSRVMAQANYVNPFGYWLCGVYFINKSLDSSDRETAASSFRLAFQATGNSSEILAADCARAEAFASSGKVPNVTYVVYEAGCAPIRMQFKMNLPLYIVAKNVPHISVNFPYLHNNDFSCPDVKILADGKPVKLEKIADMDEIIKREFNNELPSVITKTIISAAVKAATQYAAAQAAGDDWGLLVNIVGSIYQSIVNDADLRTWTTLPKQIKVASFPTPASGLAEVEGRQIVLNKTGGNVIVIKKISQTSPALVRKFDFIEAGQTPIDRVESAEKAKSKALVFPENSGGDKSQTAQSASKISNKN